VSSLARPLPDIDSGGDAAPPGPGVPRPRVVGKFLFVGERKLRVRGVTYGTFAPGPRGDGYPDPEVVRKDFIGIRSAGFNAIRTYTVPPRWVLDLAEEVGLRVMVGVAWEQHVAFLDEPGAATSIAARVRKSVAGCAGHPAVLCYAIGNEIPPSIVRWSGRRAVEGHLRVLCEAAREADAEGLITYVNFPSTEYLELPFLDLAAFNVYLDSPRNLAAYLPRLHHRAGDLPLLMGELGVDSRRNGPAEQARRLRAQVRVATSAGCAGLFAFSWTDEWHRGGKDVDDWDFGLTTRDREPKPALTAVSRTIAQRVAPASGRWPRISVVVCVYDGERTIGDCLTGLEQLNYPDYEVIVVDDGSTDASAKLAAHFDVRLLSTQNRGLSRARNTGIQAATGEIVAFIDSDARPDQDWLTHLALSFDLSEFVGMGGPNIAPPGGGRVASCVARAPGGPVHVLGTDVDAEHVPGCNMAFRRWALEEIGGFDPRFRTAGDDVDLCWRIQEAGWRIGFSPAAVVLHHPRDTIRAYWRQQVGYGAAEALLEAKWPEKYNVAGHVTWGGRVYGPSNVVFPRRRQRIYGGTWGQAAFQLEETPPAASLWDCAAMPEWYLGLGVLATFSLMGLAWSPLLLALPILLIASGATVSRCVAGAAKASFAGERLTPDEERLRRGLITLLHLIQPAARLRGRLLAGLVPWRSRSGATGFLWPRERRLRFWRWVGEPTPGVLGRLEAHLNDLGAMVRRGGNYDDWDLEVEGGGLGGARLRSCIEWHGEERQLLRIAVVPKRSTVATVGVMLAVLLSLWGLADGAVVVSLLLGGASAAVACRTVWECGTASAVLVDGARRVVDEGIELGGEGQTSKRSEVERPAASAVLEEAWLRATG
jgi:GT2 family glycosyltransferase